MVGTVKFEARIKELVENLPDLAVLVEPLLIVRRRYANRSLSDEVAALKTPQQISPPAVSAPAPTGQKRGTR
jgi:hypothetical protein